MTWLPIETAPDDEGDYILWNGEHVFFGWRSEEGWHDSRSSDWADYPQDPQPTHWMPLPEPPPAEEAGK